VFGLTVLVFNNALRPTGTTNLNLAIAAGSVASLLLYFSSLCFLLFQERSWVEASDRLISVFFSWNAHDGLTGLLLNRFVLYVLRSTPVTGPIHSTRGSNSLLRYTLDYRIL